jgi:protein-L-isoaspartate O-methyltransferase
MAHDPASPTRAVVVSGDALRAAVLANEFDDAQLIAPAELGKRSVPAARVDCTLVLADSLGTDVLAELARDGSRAPLLLEASAMSPDIRQSDLRGWRYDGLIHVADVPFVQLTPGSSEDTPDLPREIVDGAAAAGTVGHTTSGEVRRRIDDLIGQVATAPAGSGSPATTGASRPARASSGQTSQSSARVPVKLLAAAAAAALVALAISLGMAAVTNSGYVGTVVTLGVLLSAGGVLVLVILQRRAAGRTAQASTVARLAQELRDQGRRLDSLQDAINVVAATSVDTSRRLAVRQPNRSPFTDPADLVMMHQTQALTNLFRLVEPLGVIPPMGGWAASPDVIAVLVDDLLTHRPGLVVECGSGVSTLWLALVAQTYELPTRIVSLDHDAHLAELTRQSLVQHAVDHLVEVRAAPLAPTELPGHKTNWYETSAIADLHDVGLLFVDGPPDAIGPLARFPAVPLLRDRLAARATVVLDDVVAPSEKEVAMRWQVLLADFQMDSLQLQKGAVRFRRG